MEQMAEYLGRYGKVSAEVLHLRKLLKMELFPYAAMRGKRIEIVCGKTEEPSEGISRLVTCNIRMKKLTEDIGAVMRRERITYEEDKARWTVWVEWTEK